MEVFVTASKGLIWDLEDLGDSVEGCAGVTVCVVTSFLHVLLSVRFRISNMF